MTATTATRAKEDIVAVDHDKYTGQLFKITKVNPTTYGTVRVDASGNPIPGARGLKLPHELAIDPPKPGEAETVEIPTYYSKGDLVEYLGRKTIAGISQGDIAVVVNDTGSKVHIAKVGGHDGQWMTVGNRRGLKPVTVAELATQLASKAA